MEGRNDGVLSKCLLFTAFEYSCRYRVTEYICLFLSISLSICLSLSQTAVRTLSCRYRVHRDEGVLTVLQPP